MGKGGWLIYTLSDLVNEPNCLMPTMCIKGLTDIFPGPLRFYIYAAERSAMEKRFYTKYKCQTAEHAVWKIWNLVWHPFPVSVLNDPLSQSTALEICRESTHLKSRKCYSYNYQPEFPMINSKNSLRSSIKYQRFRSLASFGSSFKSYVASTLGPCSRGFGINYTDISHWWFVSSNGAWAPDEG